MNIHFITFYWIFNWYLSVSVSVLAIKMKIHNLNKLIITFTITSEHSPISVEQYKLCLHCKYMWRLCVNDENLLGRYAITWEIWVHAWCFIVLCLMSKRTTLHCQLLTAHRVKWWFVSEFEVVECTHLGAVWKLLITPKGYINDGIVWLSIRRTCYE